MYFRNVWPDFIVSLLNANDDVVINAFAMASGVRAILFTRTYQSIQTPFQSIVFDVDSILGLSENALYV